MREATRRAWRELIDGTGPVLAWEARQKGIGAGFLAQAVEWHHFIRVLPGAYRRPDDPWDRSAKLELIAAALPNAVVTLGTALALEGAECMAPFDETIWLSFPRGARVPDLKPLGARAVHSAPAVHWFGAATRLEELPRIAAHAPARAVVECLRRRNLIGHVDAASALSAALAFSLTTPEEIADVADGCRAGRIARSYLATWSRRELVSDEDEHDAVYQPRPVRRGRPPLRREKLPLVLELALRRGTLHPDFERRYDVAEAKRRLRAQGVHIPRSRPR